MHTILDLDLLTRVTGGIATSPACGTTAPAQPAKPATIDMGAPKYSAAWWDLVRARGLDK